MRITRDEALAIRERLSKLPPLMQKDDANINFSDAPSFTEEELAREAAKKRRSEVVYAAKAS